MLTQAAFIAGNIMLKGALHCHTTRSDGKGTPEEVMRLHKENGYDFMALTDHRVYNYATYAPETGITVIPGMEMDANFEKRFGSEIHCFHEVVIGPEKDKGNGFAQDQRFPSSRITGAADFQPVLDEMHTNGNLTIYCHPQWSATPAREFADLEGNIAFELWNSGCVLVDDMDVNNGFLWDELLLAGKRLWGVATDDGHEMNQHCKGWVMVNAKNDVGSILQALKNGAFYASTGPEITGFGIEDGRVFVHCSEAEHVAFYFGSRPGGMVRAEAGSTLTSATRSIPTGVPYVRAEVVDKQGCRAWTNPIFFGAQF